DADATAQRIRRELDALQLASPDDLVVVTFSGHGTDDHRLVPVDVDVDDVASSCISLVEIAELLDRIRAEQLLVVLDCCFSGGFGGARAFAPSVARSMVEDRTAVEALARGSGRIVITASGAGEPALETAEFGHGLLSFFLLNAFRGRDGLASGGRVALMDVFGYAMREVG
ncbi:MAG: caspase family protein, partial [Pseudomonadota bacterium]